MDFASSIFPLSINQRTDSGVKLKQTMKAIEYKNDFQ